MEKHLADIFVGLPVLGRSARSLGRYVDKMYRTPPSVSPNFLAMATLVKFCSLRANTLARLASLDLGLPIFERVKEETCMGDARLYAKILAYH